MRIRILSALAMVSFAAAAPATAAPNLGERKYELGDFGGRLRSIKLMVNGHEGLFTIDTGGGVSLVSPEFAASGPNRATCCSTTSIPRLVILMLSVVS